MPRPNVDEYFMSMAQLVATRSTCLRRAVGCVLVNERKHVIATGYNGNAAGLPHCNEPMLYSPGSDRAVETMYPNMCKGATAESGQNLDACQAIHAEQNAIAQCRDAWAIHTCYTTTLPCLTCIKILMNTSCERIVYAESYPHEAAVRELCGKRGIELIQHQAP